MYEEKENKIKDIMLYIVGVPLICTILILLCTFNAKAHDVNDTTVSEHSITWYIDWDSGTSYGKYQGTFVESFNIPNGAVVFWEDRTSVV